MKKAPGSVSALETVTMLFQASRSLAVPLSVRGPTLHFSNAYTTQFQHLYSAQSTSHNQLGLANTCTTKRTFTVWLASQLSASFPLPFIFLLLFLCFMFPPFSCLSLPHLLYRIIYSVPSSSCPYFPRLPSFTPQLLFVSRTFEVALTGMKRDQTHFGLCLFAVYITESFMC